MDSPTSPPLNRSGSTFNFPSKDSGTTSLSSSTPSAERPSLSVSKSTEPMPFDALRTTLTDSGHSQRLSMLRISLRESSEYLSGDCDGMESKYSENTSLSSDSPSEFSEGHSPEVSDREAITDDCKAEAEHFEEPINSMPKTTDPVTTLVQALSLTLHDNEDASILHALGMSLLLSLCSNTPEFTQICSTTDNTEQLIPLLTSIYIQVTPSTTDLPSLVFLHDKRILIIQLSDLCDMQLPVASVDGESCDPIDCFARALLQHESSYLWNNLGCLLLGLPKEKHELAQSTLSGSFTSRLVTIDLNGHERDALSCFENALQFDQETIPFENMSIALDWLDEQSRSAANNLDQTGYLADSSGDAAMTANTKTSAENTIAEFKNKEESTISNKVSPDFQAFPTASPYTDNSPSDSVASPPVIIETLSTSPANLDSNLPLDTVAKHSQTVEQSPEAYRQIITDPNNEVDAEKQTLRSNHDLQSKGKDLRSPHGIQSLLQSPEPRIEIRPPLDQAAKEAVASVVRMVESSPLSASAWYKLGNTLRIHSITSVLLQGTVLADPKSCYTRSVLLDPSLSSAWNNLGIEILRGGESQADIEAALSAFAHTLAIDPDFEGAHSNFQQTRKLLCEIEKYHVGTPKGAQAKNKTDQQTPNPLFDDPQSLGSSIQEDSGMFDLATDDRTDAIAALDSPRALNNAASQVFSIQDTSKRSSILHVSINCQRFTSDVAILSSSESNEGQTFYSDPPPLSIFSGPVLQRRSSPKLLGRIMRRRKP